MTFVNVPKIVWNRIKEEDVWNTPLLYLIQGQRLEIHLRHGNLEVPVRRNTKSGPRELDLVLPHTYFKEHNSLLSTYIGHDTASYKFRVETTSTPDPSGLNIANGKRHHIYKNGTTKIWFSHCSNLYETLLYDGSRTFDYAWPRSWRVKCGSMSV